MPPEWAPSGPVSVVPCASVFQCQPMPYGPCVALYGSALRYPSTCVRIGFGLSPMGGYLSCIITLMHEKATGRSPARMGGPGRGRFGLEYPSGVPQSKIILTRRWEMLTLPRSEHCVQVAPAMQNRVHLDARQPKPLVMNALVPQAMVNGRLQCPRACPNAY